MFSSGTNVRSLRGSLGFRSGGASPYDIYDMGGPCGEHSCAEVPDGLSVPVDQLSCVWRRPYLLMPSCPGP